MNIKSTFHLIAIVSVLLISTFSSAQSSQNNGLIYLQTDDITVEKYQALQTILKNNDLFSVKEACVPNSVKEACVPAHVISVRIPQSELSANLLQQIKSVVASAGIHSVAVLEDYNDEKFIQKCSSARTAN